MALEAGWVVKGSIKQTLHNFLQSAPIDREYVKKISTEKFVSDTINEFYFVNCYDGRRMTLLKRYLERHAKELHEFAKNPKIER